VIRAAALAILLAACSAPVQEASLPAATTDAAVQVAVQDAPLPAQVADAAGTVTEPIQDAIAAVTEALPSPPPPPPVEPLVAAPAVALIARWEVGSPSQYERRYKRPIWPQGQSGVTWCIGYDGGHQVKVVIEQDWQDHPEVVDLATTAGITGGRAKAILPRYQHIVTGYDYCLEVFTERSLVEYERRTRRAFGDGYNLLRPLARGALVSLVYNRGAAMVGNSRREMKAIRDDCVPAQDYACIAREIRSMKRLWKNTKIQNGMDARREAEAILVETEKQS
jgi:GH24 family phage-related lysozyme (muramidase)